MLNRVSTKGSTYSFALLPFIRFHSVFPLCGPARHTEARPWEERLQLGSKVYPSAAPAAHGRPCPQNTGPSHRYLPPSPSKRQTCNGYHLVIRNPLALRHLSHIGGVEHPQSFTVLAKTLYEALPAPRGKSSTGQQRDNSQSRISKICLTVCGQYL